MPGVNQSIHFTNPETSELRGSQSSLNKPNFRTKSHQHSLRRSAPGIVMVKDQSQSPKGRSKKFISLNQLQSSALKMLKKMKNPEQVYKSDKPTDIFSVASVDTLVKSAINY